MNLEMIDQVRMFMSIAMFVLGLIVFIIGTITLLIGAFGRERANVLAQTNRLAQKGLAEDVAGLVGNASMLLNAMNEMAATRNGIGIVMMIFGAALMVAGYYIMPALH